MDARVAANYTGWIIHDWEAWVVPWELSGNGHADSGSRFAACENTTRESRNISWSRHVLSSASYEGH